MCLNPEVCAFNSNCEATRTSIRRAFLSFYPVMHFMDMSACAFLNCSAKASLLIKQITELARSFRNVKRAKRLGGPFFVVFCI